MNDTEEKHVSTIEEKQFNRMLQKVTSYKKWNYKITNLGRIHEDFSYVRNRKTDSASFQVLNFLINRPLFIFDRIQLDKIQKKLTTNLSNDVIQLVNKTDQKGLKRFSFKSGNKTYYGIPLVEYTDKHLGKRKNINTNDDLLTNEKRIRSFLDNLSKNKFEIGHKDPRIPLTPENTVMQPSEINRSYKDYYIFDSNGLPLVPNPERFFENPSKYYKQKEDRKILYKALSKEFG